MKKKLTIADITNPTRRDFWTNLHDKALKRTDLHEEYTTQRIGNFTKAKDRYAPNLRWVYAVTKELTWVELSISGIDRYDIFEAFEDQSSEIEKRLGSDLNWYGCTDTSYCLIKFDPPNVGGLDDLQNRDANQDKAIENMIKLEAALRPAISRAFSGAG